MTKTIGTVISSFECPSTYQFNFVIKEDSGEIPIVNPYDLKHIAESSEAITSDMIKTLPGLQVGEAIITGNAVNHPLFVQVRPRKSKESSRLGMSFEDAIVSFNDGYKKSEKDLDSFM